MKIALSLLLLLFTFNAAIAADHETSESGFSRPEAEAEPQDCGRRIGEFSIQHQGRGLFYGSTYDLRTEFGANDKVTVSTNYGINLDVTFTKDPLTVHWSGKDRNCEDGSSGSRKCMTLVKQARKKVETARHRQKSLSVSQREAFDCLAAKLQAYEAKIEAYVPVYAPSSSSDDGTGGVGFSFDGSVGVKVGPNLIVPFDGSGLKYGF